MAMQSRVDGQYGSKLPAARPDPFAGWGTPRAVGGPFDMSLVDPELVANAIAEWTATGYAITFGRTSDGGAMGVHLLANGKKLPTYHASVEELENRLKEVIERARTLKG